MRLRVLVYLLFLACSIHWPSACSLGAILGMSGLIRLPLTITLIILD